MRKTLIFDLDGTLLNTLEDLYNAVNYAMIECDYPTHSIEEVCAFVGNGIKNLIKRAMPCGFTEEEFDRCFSYFKKYYEKHTYDCTKPYNGMVSMLKRLKNEGYRLAIVSNKADASVKKLSKYFFTEIFDVSLGAKDGINLKPDSDIVYYALKEMSSKATDAIYIGDSDVDILTAANANIPCISVLWGFRSEEFLLTNGAKITAHNVDELYSIIHDMR